MTGCTTTDCTNTVTNTIANTWVIRAQGGSLLPKFLAHGCVAIGSEHPGPLPTGLDREGLQKRLEAELSTKYSGKRYARELAVFFCEIQPGDTVIVPEPCSNGVIYRIGTIGDYRYDESCIPGHPHVREVAWQETTVSRNQFDEQELLDLDRFRYHTVSRVTNPATHSRFAA